jgi:autotransporter-associated beta strand protein
VTFTTGLTSSGGMLTKLGAGTLTLAGTSTYSGTTTVSGGKLVFQGTKSGSGDIAVADGAALGATATGTQVTPGTLTLGSSSGCTLEFNNVTSTTTAPLAAGTLSSAGTTTINIIGGTFAVGQSYPLLTWTGGSAPTVSLGTLNGASGNLSISGNTLYLNITALTYTWTGAGDRVSLANPTNWSPQGLPSGATQDTAQWNGVTTTNLVITYGTVSLPGTGFASLGINLVMTTNQTNSVQVISSASVSAGVGVNNIEVASGAGAFTWGDTTASNLLTFGRPAGAVHHFVNNSTNPATINKSVRWQAGGGNGYTYDFSGMGNWIVNSYLMPDSSAFSASYIQVDGPGMVFWSAGRTGEYSPNAPLGAVTIYGGALALKSAFPLYDILGNVPITNNATFVFDAASQSQTLSGVISGTGQLIVNNGTLTLAGQNTYSGTTTVSNGTLIINGGNAAAATIVNGGMLGGTGALSGPVTLATGTALAPGAPVGSVGTLTISNDLTLGGNLTIEVNKSVSPSNDFVVVLGVLTNTGTGTVTVANLGPALAVGDTFTLFSKLVQNGAALTVTGAGAAWANHLAVDGSITVTAITRPTLNFTQTGGSLQFSWSANFGSYKLQSQTNSLTKGLGYNWSDYPGGATSPVTVPMDAMQDTVFFRLVSTP